MSDTPPRDSVNSDEAPLDKPAERSRATPRCNVMDDMRGLIIIVAIFGIVACDIAFNNSAILNWIGTQLGIH